MREEEEEEDASNSGRMARLLIYLLSFRYYYRTLCSDLYQREVAHKQSAAWMAAATSIESALFAEAFDGERSEHTLPPHTFFCPSSGT